MQFHSFCRLIELIPTVRFLVLSITFQVLLSAHRYEALPTRELEHLEC